MNGGDGISEKETLAQAMALAAPGRKPLVQLFTLLRFKFSEVQGQTDAFSKLMDAAMDEYASLLGATTEGKLGEGKERRYYYAEKLNGSDHEPEVDDRAECAREQANLVGSLCRDGLHRPVLDLDDGAQLVPSSSQGHHHLYLDTGMEWPEYLALLRALRDAGVLGAFFVNAAEIRGQTFVRLPWVKKPVATGRRFDVCGGRERVEGEEEGLVRAGVRLRMRQSGDEICTDCDKPFSVCRCNGDHPG